VRAVTEDRAVSEDVERSAPATQSACVGVCAWAQRSAGLEAGWAAASVRSRLKVLRTARHAMASRATEFTAAISPQLARNKSDTLLGELLPLLDACKFLERETERLLRPRKLGLSGRPLWLGGLCAEVHREPLGHVVVIGPANFPLFVPGVQVLQALAAGNTVTWKPGNGGAVVAELVAQILREAGMPEAALTVTGESVDAGRNALAARPDKVVFTGSSDNGRAVLTVLAASATPAVMELSGADAIVVTPTADLNAVARAVAFGLRLNGGAVCMSPRRLFATRATLAALRPLLETELDKVPAVALEPHTADRLRTMLDEAVATGATVRGELQPAAQKPLLVNSASARMSIARNDIFAPVLSLLEVESMLHVPNLYAHCDYALTVAIFCARGDEPKARTLARMLKAGTVLINDVIAPTADPRIPFGGRGASGYGVTRGAEGLLEMTAIKTLLVRRGQSKRNMRHLEPTRDEDIPMFAAMIAATHGGGLKRRWAALQQIIKSVKSAKSVRSR
jgi:acyl-CoA reductase-like NAD-dependent aldehyde dehydrogenase